MNRGLLLLLPPPVVPNPALFGGPECTPGGEDRLELKTQDFARGIQVRLAGAGVQGMPGEDPDVLAARACQPLQPAEQVDLLGRKQLQVESARLTERREIRRANCGRPTFGASFP